MRPSSVSVLCCVIAGWATGSAAPPPPVAPPPRRAETPPCKDKGGSPFCRQWVGTDELKNQNCHVEPYDKKCQASCRRCSRGPPAPPHVFAKRDELDEAVQAFDDDPDNATFTYGPIETWDVSTITNMRGLFRGKNSFNRNVSSWNTSGVTDMSHMFEVRSDAPLYSDPHPAPRPAPLEPRRTYPPT